MHFILKTIYCNYPELSTPSGKDDGEMPELRRKEATSENIK